MYTIAYTYTYNVALYIPKLLWGIKIRYVVEITRTGGEVYLGKQRTPEANSPCEVVVRSGKKQCTRDSIVTKMSIAYT